MYISRPQDGAKHLLSAINNLSHTFPKWEDNLTTSFLFAATDLLFYHERITVKHHLGQSDLTFKNHKAAASTFTPQCCVNLSRVCIWLSLIRLKDDWRGQVSLFTVENVQQQVSKQPLKPRKKVTSKYSHFFHTQPGCSFFHTFDFCISSFSLFSIVITQSTIIMLGRTDWLKYHMDYVCHVSYEHQISTSKRLLHTWVYQL